MSLTGEKKKIYILQSEKRLGLAQWLRLHTSIARGIGLTPSWETKTLHTAERNQRLSGDTTETIRS